MTESALHILVVENHEDTLQALKIYLEQSGHRVDCVRTLAQAIEALSASDCDVLLSDIGLPDGSGWDLLKSANVKRPLYAVAMSGFGTAADLARSRAAGFRCQLVKPVDPDRLDNLLDEAARERRAQ
jgi:two-component system CheB/CheR fusion protein